MPSTIFFEYTVELVMSWLSKSLYDAKLDKNDYCNFSDSLSDRT